MKYVQAIVQFALVAILAAFVAINWNRVQVRIWPLSDTYLIVDPPVGIVAVVALLIGFVPMWLIHRASRWRLQRRIQTLEASVRAATVPAPEPTPAPPAPLDAESQPIAPVP